MGFFYTRDEGAKEWILVGSRDGLHRFRDLLWAYAANPRNDVKSEHDHYGPYSYLEIMTWPEHGLDEHSIFGPLPELERLANLVENKLGDAEFGARIIIRDEFAESSPYALVLDVRQDGFDPASADPYIPPRLL